ncbi:FtsX-like permease family protein [bacterium]|nr:FtsX-like permease family protein [bacterium]
MIRFIIKGLIRDRHRSLFPMITVTMGVALTVVAHCWVNGIIGDFIDYNARYATGHAKVVTRAYAENLDQSPNDLALLDVDQWMDTLSHRYPDLDWVARIKFGGILDAPDSLGETRAQGPAFGFGINLLSKNSREIERMGIRDGLIRGRLPQDSGEVLISESFARRLEVSPGDTVTLLGATMYGAMSVHNFRISGTVTFGVKLLDRGALIADIKEIRKALDMENAAGELLGIAKDHHYDDDQMNQIKSDFNRHFSESQDEFSPVMLSLAEQNDLASMLEYIQSMVTIMIFVFVLAMCIVLWNAGLIGGLRRYGEIGVRLAIGENKGHLYRAMILESASIGFFGSILGTIAGLGIAWYLQTYGINIGDLMENATMMMPNTFRAGITPPAYFIGIIPGLIATVLGTSLSGIGIYRRQTASLFKELEA